MGRLHNIKYDYWIKVKEPKTLKDIQINPCGGCGMDYGHDYAPMVRMDELKKLTIKFITDAKENKKVITEQDWKIFLGIDEKNN